VRHYLRILHPKRKAYTRWEWSESGFEKELHNLREYINRTVRPEEQDQKLKEENEAQNSSL
jgi:hypothetical protein